MDAGGWIALIILAAASILFATKWLPLEVTALAIPVALYAARVLGLEDAFSGFGNQASVILGCVFVIGAALQESGVTTLMARAVAGLGAHSEIVLVVTVMGVAVLLSSLMNTAAVVALLLPAIMTVARRLDASPSRLLIPLSFGALLGCNILQISSLPNILISQEVAPDLHIGMFAFARAGLPVAAAATLMMALAGTRLLPKRTQLDALREALRPEGVARAYQLHATLFRMRVVPKSKVAGRRISDVGIRARYGLDVVAVERARGMRQQILDVTPDLILSVDDELYVEGTDEAAWLFAEEENVQFGLAGVEDVERLLGRGMTLAEVALSPRSGAIGKTVRDLKLRETAGLTALALWRKGSALREGVADAKLELGDALLVSGKRERVRSLAKNADFVMLTDLRVVEDVSRAPLALLALAVAVVPAMLNLAPTVACVLVGALLAVVLRCLSVRQATQSIEWRVLFMTMGLLPLGAAFEKHGVATLLGGILRDHVATFGTAAVIAVLIVLASAVATLTTNSAAALLLGPVALALGGHGAVDARTALMAVALGSNTVFLLPYQAANLLVMGPGGYHAKDFLKVGALMTLVTLVVAVPILAFT